MEHQQKSKQDFEASSSTSSTSTMKPERFSCPECSAHHDAKRQWFLATSILLNLMPAVASITILIVFLAPLSSSSVSTNPSPPSSSSSSSPIHQNITIPHPHARRQSPIPTCLLGITEADMYTFIDSIGSKSYPGQTCQQVDQEGLIPYRYGSLYEVAVAPVGFTGTHAIDKRSDVSGDNDAAGPGHAHWHPGAEGEKREREDRTGRRPFHVDISVLLPGYTSTLPTQPIPPAPLTTGHLHFPSLHKRSGGLTSPPPPPSGSTSQWARSVILAPQLCASSSKFIVGERPQATMC